MVYVLFCVIDDPQHLSAVLGKWREAGIQGVTILESTGIRRIQEYTARKGLPLFMGFCRLLPEEGHNHNLLFAVVKDMEIVQRAVAATEAVVGDFRKPHTGIAFAVPVAAAWGLEKEYT